jgi:hypothetical protein
LTALITICKLIKALQRRNRVSFFLHEITVVLTSTCVVAAGGTLRPGPKKPPLPESAKMAPPPAKHDDEDEDEDEGED